MTGRRKARRGIIYLLVLGTAAIIAVLTLGGLLVLRAQRKGAASESDALEARLYAQSALEIGMQIVSSDDTWRTDYTSGNWRTSQPIAAGTYSLDGVDPNDGNLANSSNDSLVLTGTGVKGQATQKLQVTVFAKAKGLSCLQVDMDSGGLMSLTTSTVNAATISSNNGILALLSTINANAEAVGAITGLTFTKSITTPITARVLPQATVFNYYIANGTTIPLSSIPLSSSVRTIERRLISPNSNPFGATNSKGIYVIDCGGTGVTIRNSRIVGTLVLLNSPSASRVDDSVNWEPAVSNYPVLLVQGNIRIDTDSSSLSESSGGQNVNFNPASTPYNGTSDSDTNDSFPSEIKGLVYVSGNLTFEDWPHFTGCVVAGGTISSTGKLDITYDAKYYNDAPPGFSAQTQVYISPGTYVRMVN